MKRSQLVLLFTSLAVASYLIICSNVATEIVPSFSLLKSKAFDVKAREEVVETNKSEANKTKHILFYTKMWKHRFWNMENETVGSEHEQMQKCSMKNCIFTHKKDFLTNITDFDALIFHNGETWKIGGKVWKVPDNRSPHQLYIMAVQE